ncbi:uncharacterized protein LOC119984316 [Tripterygium wilfordii]|uniref:uncharacterized protein LOC119984316 n=1 Tax=Tripterygium wilfordii TaxID=458696 RepID=UPI0018F82F11|nr:uncharacterized protein LOC119984316 [Tripterygium wilfordii]
MLFLTCNSPRRSLIFYPNGKKNANADNHISLYLVIKETEKLPACWEVNATFKFFVFDHIRDKYLTIEGCKGSMKRFHAIKTEWGFAQFLSLDSLKNASTGYLVGDSCTFGAEIFVVKSSCKLECLSMIKYTRNNLMTWKIKKIFQVRQDMKLALYPKGDRIPKGKSLSLFLCKIVSLAPCQKLFVRFKLRIRNQIQDSDHAELIGKAWFGRCSLEWGFPNFISLQDLEKSVKGLIMNDCLMVEAEILYMSDVKSLPNVVTHSLAKHSLQEPNLKVWIEEIPSPTHLFLEIDQKNWMEEQVRRNSGVEVAFCWICSPRENKSNHDHRSLAMLSMNSDSQSAIDYVYIA